MTYQNDNKDTILIYGYNKSPYYQKVSYLLHRIKKDFTFRQIDLSQDWRQRPATELLAPFHRIPVMDHNGFVLSESLSILKYFCALWSLDELWSPQLKLQMQQDQWLNYTQIHVGGPLTQLAWDLYWAVKYQMKPRYSLIELNLKRIKKEFTLLDTHLDQSPYLVGHSESLVDLHFLPLMACTDLINIDLSAYKNLWRWYQNQRSDPTWQKLTQTFL